MMHVRDDLREGGKEGRPVVRKRNSEEDDSPVLVSNSAKEGTLTHIRVGGSCVSATNLMSSAG